ncbi:MAG: peptidylprolyl isomerase [Tepidisphaeraceae bacterium]|jgi:peptidyl-prolyl cis-trans isomerase B (cyclophilin B)
MTAVITSLAMFFSVLMPQKMWYAQTQPVTVTVNSTQDVALICTDFAGHPAIPKISPIVKAGSTVDVKSIFPDISGTGAWLLYAVPKASPSIAADAAAANDANGAMMPKDFLGVPLVLEVLQEKGQDNPEVTRVVPLNYAVMHTDAGTMKMTFFYDSAPHTVDSFLTLSAEGFYDGLTFHRIVPDFVIQGGDPTGTGLGGPGYHLDAEFNSHPHLEGVLSMARSGDPNEDPTTGIMPRAEFANSAGSQFFICLNYHNTQQLDRRYTAFGQVIEGLDVAQKIGKSPLADPQNGVPKIATVIQSVRVFPVTATDNPYLPAPTTMPSK